MNNWENRSLKRGLVDRVLLIQQILADVARSLLGDTTKVDYLINMDKIECCGDVLRNLKTLGCEEVK